MGAQEGELGADGRLVLKLRDQPGAVARVRSAVTAALEAAGLEELVDDAQLVASELVTNGLLHGGSPVRLVVRIVPPVARLEVHDPSPLPPTRALDNPGGLAGRGLHLIEAICQQWGVRPGAPGKSVWVVLEAGVASEEPVLDEDELVAMWAAEEDAALSPEAGDAAGSAMARPEQSRYRVRLGEVPTHLLLAAKEHVDNLVREFTLATTGARVAGSTQVPADLAQLLATVVHRFADARQAIKRQALDAARAGSSHTSLELWLPAEAATAAEQYLEALDRVDAYCRAARMLTLESPPQHRVFRRWYLESLVSQLRDAAAGREPVPTPTFEQRLLDELDRLSTTERHGERAERLQAATATLTAAATPEEVAAAVLDQGVAAFGADAGGLILAGERLSLEIPGTVGYDDEVLARLRRQPVDANLPAAVALRTGEAVWLESRTERDERFPELVGLEPGSVSVCAVPLLARGRCLGALRFSFAEARLFDAEEREFAHTLAQQAAQALDRARLQQHQTATMRQLQRHLVPDPPPTPPGFAVGVSHEPGDAALDAGTDFYDVWPYGERGWAVAVGTVDGAGLDAVAPAVAVRAALRMAMRDQTDPHEAIMRVRETLAMQPPDASHLCTVTVAAITATGGDAGGDALVRLAAGGDSCPLVVRRDGTAQTLALTGAPLGVAPGASPGHDRARVTLAPGDELVLLTDGATRRRDGRPALDIDDLAETVTAARAAGDATAAAVAAATRARMAPHERGEATVVTLRRSDDAGTVTG